MQKFELETINDADVSAELLEKMNYKSEEVVKAHKIFKEDYGNSVVETVISDILKGDSIKIHPDNILIDSTDFTDSTFDKKCQFVNKTLYSYQKKAIFKIREMELRGHYVDKNGDKIISNGYLLALPIGSGKSLVFNFIALFYRDVPLHPIIVSATGKSIPMAESMQWKYYPFFYEQPMYIEGKTNCVQVLTDYTQRPITVILTHDHLMVQMYHYFQNDFKSAVLNSTTIQFCNTVNDANFDKSGIIVIPANSRNMQDLVELSFVQPFMRIIIDDYTSLDNTDSMRQILASSTIFVSGSGFNRNENEIPCSYYTLKTVPSKKISIVGNPKETLEGVLRNNIATMKFIGNSNEFSEYSFVSQCEEYCKQNYHKSPDEVYPILAKQPYLSHYLTLMFVLKNKEVLKTAFSRIERDLENKTLDPNKISNYLKWKESVKNSPLAQDLWGELMKSSANSIPIVNQRCMCCGKDPNETASFGFLSLCCAAFYCSNCLQSMVTHKIVDATGDYSITDNDNYYCCVCRKKNCKFFMNSTKMKDRNIYAFSLIDDYTKEAAELKNHLKVDYYFYAFLNGLTPIYQNGKPLNIHEDINQGLIVKPNVVPKIECIFSIDQLAVRSLITINKTLGELKICPKKPTFALYFDVPGYMQSRLTTLRETIIKENKKQTQVKYVNGKIEKMIQPLENIGLVFRNSMASLIGLHSNIIAICVWNSTSQLSTQDNIQQMLGRILRINTFDNPLYFYIETDRVSFS